MVMGCRNTTHPEGAEQDDYVRTVERLAGFTLRPDPRDKGWSEMKVSNIQPTHLPLSYDGIFVSSRVSTLNIRRQLPGKT